LSIFVFTFLGGVLPLAFQKKSPDPKNPSGIFSVWLFLPGFRRAYFPQVIYRKPLLDFYSGKGEGATKASAPKNCYGRFFFRVFHFYLPFVVSAGEPASEKSPPAQ